MTHVHHDDGLATLGPGAVALRDALEQRFESWAASCGAERAIYPALMRVEDLAGLDYFENFPHLAVMTSGVNAPALAQGLGDPSRLSAVAPEDLEESRLALPSAACFNVYLHLRGRTLDGPVYVTTAANCFRREQRYEGLRRLLAFYMREIVCVGEREAVLEHLNAFKTRIR